MSQIENATPESPPLSGVARLLWAVLILATLYLCYFHNLGALGLVGPDEPRYAWIARDMAESGDWVTPRLYGQPWLEKPPLYYWGAALSFKLFGVSETTARLPSAVCALLATLALAWLALRLYGAETARWQLVLLPTTVGMIGFSHAAATDMPFAAMLTIAMVFAAGIIGLVESKAVAVFTPKMSFYTNTRPVGILSQFLFGFFLGLATLAKGPAALILSGGAVLLWAALTKRWREAFRCLHPIAILGFCATALPWYIVCAKRNPDFFRVFIIEHNFKRFLTPEFQHIQPVWYYLPILLLAIFPWAIFFPTSVYILSRTTGREPRTSSVDLFCFCCALFPLLFFSASRSKLPGYILPSLPMLGMLVARMLGAADAKLRCSAICSGIASAIVSGFGALLLSVVPNLLPPKLQNFQYVSAYALVSLAITFCFLALSLQANRLSLGRASAAVVGFGLFLFTVFIATGPQTMIRVGVSTQSARDLSRALLASGGNSENLQIVGLTRSTHYQLNFYLHANLQDWDGEAKPGELLVGRSISCSGLRLGASCKDLWGMIDKTDDWELLEISPSASLGGLGGSLGRGGSGSAGSSRGGLNNGQPR